MDNRETFLQIFREDLQSEIDGLEELLARVTIRLAALDREEEDRVREQGRTGQGGQREQLEWQPVYQRFQVNNCVAVDNRQDSLHGTEGMVTKISHSGHFVYFQINRGVVRYRGPQNPQLVQRDNFRA